MKYYISIIVVIAILIAIFAITKYALKKHKRHKKNSTVTVSSKKTSINSNLFLPKELKNLISPEIQATISEYFDELNQIQQLYAQRENNLNAVDQCIGLCYLNINTFPMVLEAMDFDTPQSLPAFERLAIIYEKREQYSDALEIAQIQAFFSPTEKCLNRINRLSNKINKNSIDKSTGNIELRYHYIEIKNLKGTLPNKVKKIFDIIRKAPFKFESVSRFVEDYVVLDVETTGLNYNIDSIVEIGCIKFRNNIEVERFHTLINPNTPIPPQATEIHNITDDMVKDAPYIDEKLPELIDFIGDDIIIGHNVGFDIRFVINACLWAFIQNPKFKAIDTLKLARKYIANSDLDNYSLDTIRQFLSINQSAHRALNDCEATAQLYKYCYAKEYYNEQ